MVCYYLLVGWLGEWWWRTGGGYKCIYAHLMWSHVTEMNPEAQNKTVARNFGPHSPLNSGSIWSSYDSLFCSCSSMSITTALFKGFLNLSFFSFTVRSNIHSQLLTSILFLITNLLFSLLIMRTSLMDWGSGIHWAWWVGLCWVVLGQFHEELVRRWCE